MGEEAESAGGIKPGVAERVQKEKPQAVGGLVRPRDRERDPLPPTLPPGDPRGRKNRGGQKIPPPRVLFLPVSAPVQKNHEPHAKKEELPITGGSVFLFAG